MGLCKCRGKGSKCCRITVIPVFPSTCFCSLLNLLPCIRQPSNFSLKILDKNVVLYMEKYGTYIMWIMRRGNAYSLVYQCNYRVLYKGSNSTLLFCFGVNGLELKFNPSERQLRKMFVFIKKKKAFNQLQIFVGLLAGAISLAQEHSTWSNGLKLYERNFA